MSLMKTRKRAAIGWLAAGATAAAMAAAVALPGAAAHAAPAGSSAAGQLAASSKPAAAAYVPPTRTLQYGDRGADVLALQQRLHSLHYWLKITGVFDFDTREAMYAFQSVNGLSMDGVVGPQTKRALEHPHTYKAQDPSVATR
ncbi:MAG: putative peptidoglycan-binding protein, partial [Actinomycetia bacterium]|nr:putative peptidoglycan-binding protein [Actinomycetes bacterium]